MPKKLVVAVLAALALDVLATGYGTVAVGQEDHVQCLRDHGSVANQECVRAGHVLFRVRP
jgi:hypothetical protein